MTVAPSSFYDDIVHTLEQRRSELASDEASFFNREMSEAELKEYLSFQAYYEMRAAQFIARWLSDTPERDAFVLLAQQVEDEALHYEYCLRALSKLGVDSIDGWEPEPEWVEWIDVWYPSGDTTIERVASHNVTGELGACQAFLEVKPRLPEFVQKTFDRIIPDEQFHMKIGRTVLERYCVTEEQQEKVRDRVMHTFELEQAGRAAYNRRMVRMGIADVGDPVPPLG